MSTMNESQQDAKAMIDYVLDPEGVNAFEFRAHANCDGIDPQNGVWHCHSCDVFDREYV